MIHIFLVDDHKILRKGLKMVLGSESNFTIVGESDSVKEAITIIPNLPKIDVVLTGIILANESGLDLIKYLTTHLPNVKSLVLSMHSQCTYVMKAVEIGALGYVTKDSDYDDLIQAIHQVSQGNTFFAENMEVKIAECEEQKLNSKERGNVQLSAREHEVLQHIIKGWSNKMIGDKMFVSESTVNTHRYHLMKKLNAKNSADLVRIALSNDFANQQW